MFVTIPLILKFDGIPAPLIQCLFIVKVQNYILEFSTKSLGSSRNNVIHACYGTFVTKVDLRLSQWWLADWCSAYLFPFFICIALAKLRTRCLSSGKRSRRTINFIQSRHFSKYGMRYWPVVQFPDSVWNQTCSNAYGEQLEAYGEALSVCVSPLGFLLASPMCLILIEDGKQKVTQGQTVAYYRLFPQKEQRENHIMEVISSHSSQIQSRLLLFRHTFA
ncbi:hypothetical protein VNO77_41021 [Canavalia gladiata]|uniref:Uncharacterized protein n=1 Tax=Canavalia gladiata TaxID=3824 RepID=A0AAN9K0C3_CANGL